MGVWMRVNGCVDGRLHQRSDDTLDNLEEMGGEVLGAIDSVSEYAVKRIVDRQAGGMF